MYIVYYINGCRIYVDIMTGEKKFRQFSLLAWNLFIGQFVYPVEGEGIEIKRVEGGNSYIIPLQVLLY